MGLVTGISSAAVFMATIAFPMVTILSMTIDCTSWVVLFDCSVEDYAKAMRLKSIWRGVRDMHSHSYESKPQGL